MILKIVLLSIAVFFVSGCLTPQGRAIREAGNIYFSKKLAKYCRTPKPERDVVASAINRRLHFTGEVRILCPVDSVEESE